MSKLKLMLVGAFMMMVAWCCFPQNAVVAKDEPPKFNDKACSVASGAQREALGCDDKRELPDVAQNIINGIISAMGILAVLMIVMSGQRYATSAGDPQKAAKAKSAIIWSAVGLVIALVSAAVVNFVLGSL